MYRAETEAERV